MMRDEVVQGSTVSFRFTFREIDVNDISTAYLVIKQNNKTVVKKGLESAYTVDNGLEWKLTQEESFLMPLYYEVSAYCDWKLVDGTRGRSKKGTYKVVETGVDEVI